MSASLVGSEMCIRDSPSLGPGAPELDSEPSDASSPTQKFLNSRASGTPESTPSSGTSTGLPSG
eukprot:6064809-Alexandrium_andersonii.AAC.1